MTLDFPNMPEVSGESEFVLDKMLDSVDNDSLPWQHVILANNRADTVTPAYAGFGLPNASWHFSTVTWTAPNGGELLWDLYLAAGNWQIEWFSDKRSDYGIQETRWDGASYDSVDHYAATRTRFVHKWTKNNVPRGWHSVGRKVNGKNASSTNYLMTFSAMILTRLT